jgi:exopolysaccharide biosynthesis polyprenyl glycosylphosphotransferase
VQKVLSDTLRHCHTDPRIMNASSDRRSDASRTGSQASLDLPIVNRPQDAPKGSRRLRWLSVGTDAVAASLVIVLALLPDLGWHAPVSVTEKAQALLILVALNIAVFSMNRLYQSRTASLRAVETAALLRAVFITGVIGLAIRPHVLDEFRARRLVLVQAFVFLGVFFGRQFYRFMLKRARRHGRFMRPVVLVGAGDEAFELLKILRDEPELGFDVRGIVGDQEAAQRLADESVPYLGSTDQVGEAVVRAGAYHAIIGATAFDFRELNRTVRVLTAAGVHVQISGGLAGISANRLRRAPIGREATFYLEQVSLEGWQATVKRIVDVVLTLVVLIPALPIMGILALLVRRHDGGPAFFRQQRIGLDGQPFTILKLRTMVVDAEARLAELMAKNERSGPLFKLERDPRLTPIGRLMDATSLNELPQLFNVLKGDMSLVGPRPALPREVATFDERLMLRHLVRPGITGLWQVESRDSPSFADYERCDVFYVENWSVQLDMAILVQTVGSVMQRALNVLRRDDSATGEQPADPNSNVVSITSKSA